MYAERTSMKFDQRKHFVNPNILFDLLIHFPAIQWVTLFPLKALYKDCLPITLLYPIPILESIFFIKTLIYQTWMKVDQHEFWERCPFLFRKPLRWPVFLKKASATSPGIAEGDGLECMCAERHTLIFLWMKVTW